MRKGVSFTLTMVVTGVILIMTALSIITLGGGSIQDFFGQIGSQQQEAVEENKVRDACRELVNEVNQGYCDRYVNQDCSGKPSYTRDDPDKETATSLGCDWQKKWADQHKPDSINGWEVTVEGNAYNCADEGYVNPRTVCPADTQLQ